MYNIKYVIMAVVLVHICIHRKDSCKPRWRLSVDYIELTDTESDRTQHRNCQNKSMETAHKILTGCGNKKFDYTVYIYIYL